MIFRNNFAVLQPLWLVHILSYNATTTIVTMKENQKKSRIVLAAALIAASAAVLTSCSPQVEANDSRSRIDRKTYAEKISRFGHSYIYLQTQDQWGPTFLHDPDCPCQKGGAR